MEDRFGESCVPLGDVTGDGVIDIAVGAPGYYGNFGDVVALSGADGSIVHLWCDPDGYGYFGTDLANVGDLDGDAVDDLAIGAPYNHCGHEGSVYVHSGRTGSHLRTLTDGLSCAYFGRSIDAAGDVDRDGFVDLVVGAASYRSSVDGQVYVVSAHTGAFLRVIKTTIEHFGVSVANLGDVNADGASELLIGSPAENRVYIYSGRSSRPLRILEGEARSLLGWKVARAGDTDRDGIPDLAASAINWSGSMPSQGQTSLWAGSELFLDASPMEADPGDTMVFEAREGPPGAPAALLVVDVDTEPDVLSDDSVFVVATGVLDAVGDYSYSAVVPPGLSGLTMTFQVFAAGLRTRGLSSAPESIALELQSDRRRVRFR